MTVNHSSVLSVDYFEAYFKLVGSSRNYDIEKANEYMTQNFFKGDLQIYGKETYQSFVTAYQNLKNNSK
ncbi:hypothetical protein [Neobacillus sp. NPDC093127]|uniref:hypothetical protein n=1 Tax=Neobacillus sp. NPDC093127 TaxID=3364296 RepID=UPI0037F2FAC4